MWRWIQQLGKSEYVTVAEFSMRPQAELAKNLLESHGITAVLRADDAAGLIASAAFVQPIELQVHTSHAESAREILGEEAPSS